MVLYTRIVHVVATCKGMCATVLGKVNRIVPQQDKVEKFGCVLAYQEAIPIALDEQGAARHRENPVDKVD